MSLTIKPATAQDIEQLTQLGRTTFVESYEHIEDPIHFQKHLARNHTVEFITKEVYTPRNQFFIARINDSPIGFCKLVSNENEQHPLLKNHKCIELERMYVLQKFQGLNVGHVLLGESLKFASENNFEIIWLGVSQKNERAIKIYERWGFVYFDTHLFDLGGEMLTDLMMKRSVTLQKGTPQTISKIG